MRASKRVSLRSRARSRRSCDERARAVDRREHAAEHAERPRYRLAFILFALSCASTTFAGWLENGSLRAALAYSVPLMAILLAHELGHYVAARIHRVPASLPYFIPMPLPPLGTMGAVILMRNRIASRNALLDVGAAGPLAGLLVALPVLIYGIAQSKVAPRSGRVAARRPLAAVPRALALAEGADPGGPGHPALADRVRRLGRIAGHHAQL